MSQFDQFVAANTTFAESFDQGALPMPPARHVAVVTCMDARLHPETFLGLAIGDAHVIRNAGAFPRTRFAPSSFPSDYWALPRSLSFITPIAE